MKKKLSRDPVAAFEREARAARRVGKGSKCKCGEDRPLALIPGSDPVICAACQREKNGRSPFDNHHPAGKANSPIDTPIHTNEHRVVLSPKQYEWPEETWENRNGSPLRASAACVRGYCETNDYLVASLLIPRAEMLEVLDGFLEKRLGPNWWVGTEMERFAPKRKRKRARSVKSAPVVRNPRAPGTLNGFFSQPKIQRVCAFNSLLKNPRSTATLI